MTTGDPNPVFGSPWAPQLHRLLACQRAGGCRDREEARALRGRDRFVLTPLDPQAPVLTAALLREEVDLDTGVLRIRQATFGKSRLVPMAPDLTERRRACQRCLDTRLGLRDPQACGLPGDLSGPRRLGRHATVPPSDGRPRRRGHPPACRPLWPLEHGQGGAMTPADLCTLVTAFFITHLAGARYVGACGVRRPAHRPAHLPGPGLAVEPGAAPAPAGGAVAWPVGLSALWHVVRVCGMLQAGSWDAPPSRCFTSCRLWRRP